MNAQTGKPRIHGPVRLCFARAVKYMSQMPSRIVALTVLVLVGCGSSHEGPFDGATEIPDAFAPDTHVAVDGGPNLGDARVTDAYVADAYVADAYVADVSVADAFVVDADPCADAVRELRLSATTSSVQIVAARDLRVHDETSVNTWFIDGEQYAERAPTLIRPRRGMCGMTFEDTRALEEFPGFYPLAAARDGASVAVVFQEIGSVGGPHLMPTLALIDADTGLTQATRTLDYLSDATYGGTFYAGPVGVTHRGGVVTVVTLRPNGTDGMPATLDVHAFTHSAMGLLESSSYRGTTEYGSAHEVPDPHSLDVTLDVDEHTVLIAIAQNGHQLFVGRYDGGAYAEEARTDALSTLWPRWSAQTLSYIGSDESGLLNQYFLGEHVIAAPPYDALLFDVSFAVTPAGAEMYALSVSGSAAVDDSLAWRRRHSDEVSWSVIPHATTPPDWIFALSFAYAEDDALGVFYEEGAIAPDGDVPPLLFKYYEIPGA